MILIGFKQRLSTPFLRNSPAHSRHSMQHNLMPIFLSIFCSSYAFRHIWSWEAENLRAATRCNLPKAHKIPSLIYAHAPPSVFAGSQTVCFDPYADPVMNKTSGCGPDTAQRDRPRAAAKPCRATISSHTLTSEASQHQNHASVTTSATHSANAHNVFLCQIDKI